jgi:hypothetical protein
MAKKKAASGRAAGGSSAAVVRDLAKAMDTLSMMKAQNPSRKQKKRKTPGPGAGGSAAPVAYGNVVTNKVPNAINVPGVDFIDAEQVTSGAKPGDTLLVLSLNPARWKGTHIAQLCESYERYRFTRLSFIVNSRAPTAVGGGYFAGTDLDPERIPGVDPRRFVRSLPGSKSAPFWMGVTVPVNIPSSQHKYIAAGEEERLSSYGNFYLVVDQAPNAVGVISGGIQLTVEVQYNVQLIEPITAQRVDAAVIHFPEDNIPFDADGVGALVEGTKWKTCWDQAQYDYPYEIFPTKASIKMKDPDGSEVSPAYFRSLKTSDDKPAFVFFKDIATARAAGPNPSRDATKMLKLIDKTKPLTFTRFVGIPAKP